jgi:phosphatidylinositol glycan class T
MQISWKARFFLGFSLCLSTFAYASGEKFDEQLSIQSLRDGKVASTFSFKTSLEGVSPRDPRTLGEDDVCV